MSNPIPGKSDEPQRPAEPPHRDAAGAEREADRDATDALPDDDDSERALGGADSVEKTTWVVGSGTEPESASHGQVTARANSGGGINVGAWVVGLIALAIALVYGAGFLR
jgi:hypothetical protein